MNDLGGYDRLQRRYMPPQKISLKKKNEKWRRKCVDYVVTSCGTVNPWCNNPARISNYRKNVNIYEGVLDEQQLEYITKPFNVEDRLPARLKDMNLVRPIIDSMIGEEVNRPFKFVVARTSEGANNDFQEAMKEQLIAYAMGCIVAKMDPQEAQLFEQETQSGQIPLPEELQRWMQESYKDIAEEFNSKFLQYLISKMELKTIFVEGYKDLLLNREEIYYVGEEYGKANLRRVNPAAFSYEYSPDMKYIEDCTWCAERIVLSYSELHDRFRDDLDDETLDQILSRIDGSGGAMGKGDHRGPYDMGAYHENWFDFSTIAFPFQSASEDCIPIWKVHWKSFRKILFVTLNDPETNRPYVEVVDENYVETGEEENIREEWIAEIWQGYKVLGDIYFGVRPITCSFDYTDPTSIKMPYVGLAAQGRSVVELMESVNIMYLSLWYRLELLLARDNGRAIVMDVTQIPKSQGLDLQKWAHMLKALGVALINPYESGWNVPGKDGTRPSAFNAFSAVDLSMSQSIGMYIDLINKVEQICQQIVGFNPQRLGQVGKRDLASTTHEALNQSYNTSAYIVYMHDMVKQRSLRKLLNVSLSVRYRTDDQFLNYIGQDGMRLYLTMPKTAIETMDLFVSSSAEEVRKLEELKQLYQPAMQNGATLVDVIQMMEADNLTTIRLKMEEIERRKQQMIQQQEQQQQQVQQAQMQQVEMDRQVSVEQKNADRALKKYMADLQSQTTLQVEQIKAQNEAAKLDGSLQINPLDEQRLELDRMKIEGELANKASASETAYQKLSHDMSSAQRDLELKQEELALQIAVKEKETQERSDAEYRKFKFEQEKMEKQLEIEREKLENRLKELRVAHELEMKTVREEASLEMKKLREELAAQLKMAKMGEAHELKMAKEEERKEVKMTKLEQAHDKKITKMESEKEKQLKEKDNEAKRKLEKMKIDEERRKANEAAKRAEMARKKKSDGSSSSGSKSSGGSSGSPKNSNNGGSNSSNGGSTTGGGLGITVIKI